MSEEFMGLRMCVHSELMPLHSHFLDHALGSETWNSFGFHVWHSLFSGSVLQTSEHSALVHTLSLQACWAVVCRGRIWGWVCGLECLCMWEACACRTEPRVEREKAPGWILGIGSLCSSPSYAERTLRCRRIINVKLAFQVHLKVYL